MSNGADVNLVDHAGETPLHVAARRGELSCAQVLVHYGARSDIKDKDGETALDLAREQGNEDLFKLLKQHGAKE